MLISMSMSKSTPLDGDPPWYRVFSKTLGDHSLAAEGGRVIVIPITTGTALHFDSVFVNDLPRASVCIFALARKRLPDLHELV